MPWDEVSIVSLRQEFVWFASQECSNLSELCRRYGISRNTGHKWLNRFRSEGSAGLVDRSRRPHSSPDRIPDAWEYKILALRDQHPAWGGRKLRRRLFELGERDVPAASTITEVLRRNNRLNPEESEKRKALQRFEMSAPNEMWQMDFKGPVSLSSGDLCHPFTSLDDHSRYSIILQACPDQRRPTVQEHLTTAFRTYGLPDKILADNGAPWGGMVRGDITKLAVWLIRLNVKLIHGRSYHPQTQGKEERFHRTLQDEVLSQRSWPDIKQCDDAFNSWRDVYNYQRPHESLDMDVPAKHYQPSSRTFPESLSPVEYDTGLDTRKVDTRGDISYKGHTIRIGKALYGYRVALKPTQEDRILDVIFASQRILKIDLDNPKRAFRLTKKV